MRASARQVDVASLRRDAEAIDWELRLGFLIHDVSRLRRNAFDRCLKPMSVTRSQWWVLAYLSRQDGMTQSQLAEALGLGKVAVGALVDRLEKAGIVRRATDARDRRVNRLFLQPGSASLIGKMRLLNQAFNQCIRGAVEDREVEATAHTLDAMKRNLVKYLAR